MQIFADVRPADVARNIWDHLREINADLRTAN